MEKFGIYARTDTFGNMKSRLWGLCSNSFVTQSPKAALRRRRDSSAFSLRGTEGVRLPSPPLSGVIAGGRCQDDTAGDSLADIARCWQ